MASAKGMKQRHEAAQERIGAALASLDIKMSLDLGELPKVGIPTIQEDTMMQLVKQREFLADAFEALLSSIGEE